MIEIRIPIRGNPEEKIQEGAKKAKGLGLVFTPASSTSGKFHASNTDGEYKVENGVLVVTITKKPSFAPKFTIEQALRSFFG